LAAPLAAAALLSACATAGPAASRPSADLAAIVIPERQAVVTETARPSNADLDIDDQAGDGSRVAVESVTVDEAAFVVITDLDGDVLGWDTAKAGVQPVWIVLRTPVSESVELLGSLVRDDGDGVLDLSTDLPLVDDEGDVVEEDFDYRVTGPR